MSRQGGAVADAAAAPPPPPPHGRGERPGGVAGACRPTHLVKDSPRSITTAVFSPPLPRPSYSGIATGCGAQRPASLTTTGAFLAVRRRPARPRGRVLLHSRRRSKVSLIVPVLGCLSPLSEGYTFSGSGGDSTRPLPPSLLEKLFGSGSTCFQGSLPGIVKSARFRAHLSSNMSRSIGFHICMVICSILLYSTSLQCLSFQTLKKDTGWVQQTALAGNGLEDKSMSMQSLENNLRPSEQTAHVAVTEEPSGVSAEPSGTSLNKIFTAKGETQHTSLSDNLFIGSKSLDVYTPVESMVATDESELSPTGPNKELSENGLLKAMLTTALTTLNPDIEADVLSSTVIKTTVGGSTEAGHSFISDLDNYFFRTDAIEGKKKADDGSDLSATPQLSYEERPTLHPRAQNSEVVSDYPTSPVILADQTADSEHGTPKGGSLLQLTAADALTAEQTFVSTDASLNLEAETDSRQGSLRVEASAVTVAPAVSVLSDDWDDTKLGAISQVRGSKHEEIKQNYVGAEPPWTTGGDEEDDVKRAMPFTASADAATMKLEKNMFPEPAQVPVQGEVMPTFSAVQTSVYFTSPLAEAEVAAIDTMKNTEPITMEDRKSVSLLLPETVTMMDTKSNVFLTPGNTLQVLSVPQEMMTASQETDATLPVMTPPCFAIQETTRETSVTEEERKGGTLIPTVSSVAQLLKKSEHSDATSSFTATYLSIAKTPDAEGRILCFHFSTNFPFFL
uniref:Uncharacterized protein n=1 Tax=Pelodiscus sinensis TaxID=13735 RepID=K7G192_PELSI